MKLFISADIEGCAGLALIGETHKAEAVYQAFAKEMTEEVRQPVKQPVKRVPMRSW